MQQHSVIMQNINSDYFDSLKTINTEMNESTDNLNLNISTNTNTPQLSNLIPDLFKVNWDKPNNQNSTTNQEAARKFINHEINSNSINKEIIVREKEKILNSNLGDSSEHDYCLMKFSVKLRDLPKRQLFNLLEINYIAKILKDYCENGTKISENYEGLEAAIRKLKSESNSKVFPARNENGCIFGISDDELRSRITYKLFKDFEVLKSNEKDETAYQYFCNYRSKKFQYIGPKFEDGPHLLSSVNLCIGSEIEYLWFWFFFFSIIYLKVFLILF